MSEVTLDIDIIDTYNSKTLTVVDISQYPTGLQVKSPRLQVTLPGYENPVILQLSPRQINVYNSHNLKLSAEHSCIVELPDGIYKLKFSIYPHYKNKIEKNIIRVNNLVEKFYSAFINKELSGCCHMDDSYLNEVEYYIQGAIATAGLCNDLEAMNLYNRANSMLEKINCHGKV